MKETFYQFSSDSRSVISKTAAGIRTTYAPLCGKDSMGIKGSITPFLSGDIKIDKFRYLTKPVSTEDLRHGTRNFYLRFDNGEMISLAEPQSGADSHVELGFLWHKVVHKYPSKGLEIELLNFVPVSGENAELMRIRVTNTDKKVIRFTPYAAVTLFGRSLANKHDHEHVTSLLHRAKQVKNGIIVEPTMRFNEEGHKICSDAYFVLGCDAAGKGPDGSFPTFESFYGYGGTFERPEAVINGVAPRLLPENEINGKEIVGALQFAPAELAPGSQAIYLLTVGIADNSAAAETVFTAFNNDVKFTAAYKDNDEYWNKKVESIEFKTASSEFNAWMRWVTLQPVLRRIYGCSFLPDHDYGKGGKGWRDLWQDLLSLILIEPENVRGNLINNFAGIRIDGTNATIIGSAPGEFIADRNAITRVWMDHGVWPFLTTQLYIDQTGDYDLLYEMVNYFRDPQFSRSFDKDTSWTPAYGQWLKTKTGGLYQGSILEHILLQNLVQFFNVGEHNITRLESADWNDGLDMAFKRGESVTFMAFYGGNLARIAGLLERLKTVKNISTVTIASEIAVLLDTLNGRIDYDSAEAKHDLLFNRYFPSVQPELSGELVEINVDDVIADLRRKSDWIAGKINSQEKVNVKSGGKEYSWFNGYYDNQAKRVEGITEGNVRMTLTGQVFPVMSGIAGEKDIVNVVNSVRAFLKDKELGGFRLNSDFGVRHYLDMGRAFGFAYGTKENGAFFSHMTVMYAYALYSRGFVKEGFEVLNSIYEMSRSEKAKIYPGVPEYFDSLGKGMYHYLTGSASWFVLTLLTQVFGVRGKGGDLALAPRLLPEQFDNTGTAAVKCGFAGKDLTVIYQNKKKLGPDKYKVAAVSFDGEKVKVKHVDGESLISRDWILSQTDEITLIVILE
jgi:cellobiose phosphorylase